MSEVHAALEVLDLRKRYGGVVALAGVDVRIEAGQVTALLGENGAGKSTLVACCSGARSADTGEVLIFGEPVKFASPNDATKAGVAVVHQEPQMLEHQTVAQNLFIGDLASRKKKSRSRAEMVRVATEQLRQLGLDGALDPSAQLGELSGAQRQLVEIARALRETPRVLFLDEPNATLGNEETEQLFAVVRRLRDDGVAVILVSHRLAEVYRIADRVVVMRDGQKVADGTTAEVPLARAVELMGGRPGQPDLTGSASSAGLADGSPVLELRGLSGKGFANVDLAIRPGEILGMAGLVGAGRTEIALGVVGATPTSGGEVLVGGERQRFSSPGDALRQGVVYVAEDRKNALFYDKSVGFNIRASLLGRTRAGSRRLTEVKAKELSAKLFARLAVKAPSQDVPARSLSGGNQQKLLFARAASTQPKVLILDEPTHGVDIGSRSETHDFIRQLASEGVAVWVISSELDEILAVATRIVVVRDGSIQTEVGAGEDPTQILAAALGVPANYQQENR
ncbi:sugar ABC transporter ATP-binding protein [Propionicimonas sp.]|uniref:sugar ABC transporter ATP-binding protein n=1 Tax=Propionicimonas sp. TaxID=1955623 RepID=UPI00183436EF|nr:sugar ABC transporter ATP-binding protein [Propionicimonas sp.]MBU3976823.1 sugar ABC transporter ATP-binding protein [Actinomycetota bacterium]MBA3019512.1 sugar ABC transporter ATP-binding protein [Propionicimonas sp.]MBU3986918.1 sugar ABC transporter ATP-binding protein [Actinomycetota bacterium]MBU4006830.1 sugar ABC transporter ATP-binding protein [Actinomycetota bacterium]MBU4065530.1 sugar ABC transporter ATP-binding protein [Actinomycetota bacterium]